MSDIKRSRRRAALIRQDQDRADWTGRDAVTLVSWRTLPW